MVNRQLYTMKFKSSRLKKYNYDITLDFQTAMNNEEIVALSDNQILRTIRDVVINKTGEDNRRLDRELLETFYETLNTIRKKKNNQENIKQISDIKEKINKMCFIPEYITIVIEDDSHYDYMYYNGLKINGTTYYRISVSAGQGRVKTVAFCSSEVLETVNEILDNGRDKTKKFSPSKFNAYKGTYGSGTKVVTTPRFCVVPDYESEVTFQVNWVTETEGEQDDIIEERTITRNFNRWDGMGLISPQMAEIWAKDLDLDYIPAQFCIRQSFLKGMLCVFPIHEFCEKKNNENYIIKSSYKDKDGNIIEIDLRNIDVIITESQFKLWDSYSSLESYIDNCTKNNLKWGVSLYTDKELKNVLTMNYQFLQALNIDKNDIPKICEDFVEWIQGVNSENIWYTLLFLLGKDTSQNSIEKYLKHSNNYWIKSLIVNHDLINDKYIKQKIYNLVKNRIESGCLGSIILEGNNQTLVSDPYAMMEFLCGNKNPQGLLGKGRYYANYWNERGVKEILGMRPPLTYRSECTRLVLDNTEEQRYWYRYSYGGIIVNIHGHETDNWAGSDWDYDFLSTTSNGVAVNGVYKNELPVCYQAPKPDKIIFTDEDLFKCDKFTFGSKIGAITNKSTTGHSLLIDLEEKYGVNSREYQTTLKRIKMCTKLQSAQIDKAKIGRDVKGIPKIWTDRYYIDSLDLPNEEKDFLKRIMLDKHPYFFTYLYPDTKKKYKKFIEEYKLSCKHKFNITLEELLEKENRNVEEEEYVQSYYEYMPVITSDCVMNGIARYIENINFNIKSKIKKSESKDIHLILMRNENIIDEEIYNNILQEFKTILKERSNYFNIKDSKDRNKYIDSEAQESLILHKGFIDRMDKICSNTYELIDYLIRIFYVEMPSVNKDLLWNTYGEFIFKNIKDKNQNSILFPFPSDNGDIKYLNQMFELKEVNI